MRALEGAAGQREENGGGAGAASSAAETPPKPPTAGKKTKKKASREAALSAEAFGREREAQMAEEAELRAALASANAERAALGEELRQLPLT